MNKREFLVRILALTALEWRADRAHARMAPAAGGAQAKASMGRILAVAPRTLSEWLALLGQEFTVQHADGSSGTLRLLAIDRDPRSSDRLEQFSLRLEPMQEGPVAIPGLQQIRHVSGWALDLFVDGSASSRTQRAHFSLLA